MEYQRPKYLTIPSDRQRIRGYLHGDAKSPEQTANFQQ